MSTNEAFKKQPVCYREPVLGQLILKELVDLSSDSRFDKHVLTWMQDRYAQQAIAENMQMLIDAMNKGKQAGQTPAEMLPDRIRMLISLTQETYSSEKSLGRGFDLKTYLDAATTFCEAESMRYSGQLKDVSEEIAKALANGEKPDIDRISRTVYAATFKMSGAVDSLERINKPSADAVAKLMEAGIKMIERVAVTDAELNVGRVLFQAIEKISLEPERYIQFIDPARMEMPPHQVWDYEPVQRSPSI